MSKFRRRSRPTVRLRVPVQFINRHRAAGQKAQQSRQDAIQRDIANFKAGLKAAGLSTEGAWMNAIAPASCARMPNEYYKSEELLHLRRRHARRTRRSSRPA